jgi:hypothetical protein
LPCHGSIAAMNRPAPSRPSATSLEPLFGHGSGLPLVSSVGAAHLPFPGLGHLRRDADRYTWVPVTFRSIA